MSKQRDGMMLSDLAKIFRCTESAEVLPDNQLKRHNEDMSLGVGVDGGCQARRELRIH